MKNSLAFISVFFVVFGIVFGSSLVVKAEVAQSLLVGVKKDPDGGFMNADLNDRYWISRIPHALNSNICFCHHNGNRIKSKFTVWREAKHLN